MRVAKQSFTILSMRSAPDPVSDDRTAKARIRDAAITRFAADGVSATSVRAIAGDAEVSPALVIHHFGSKDALRHECDEYVAAVIRRQKHDAMVSGPSFDPLAALRASQSHVPLTAYLARTLVDGSPRVAELIDELVDDAADYMAEGVAAGTLLPTAYPYGRAAVVTLISLGMLVLHEHLNRLLGVDLTQDLAGLDDPTAAAAYIGPMLELFTNGLVSDDVATAMRAAFVDGGGHSVAADAATT